MEEELLTFFPNGIRALLVDDNPKFINSARKMLNLLQFKVTTFKTPSTALKFVSKNQKEIIDVILIEAHTVSTCGFDLRAIIERDLCIPVIYFMSQEDPVPTGEDETLSRMVQAATFIVKKPFDAFELGSLWRVIAYRRLAWDARKANGHNGHSKGKHASPCLPLPTGSSDDDDEDNDDEIESLVHFRVVQTKKPKEPHGAGSSETKKRHIVRTRLLKEKFEHAVNDLGIGYPSKILEYMNVKGLRRHHVASRLQKYRAKLQVKNDPRNTSNRSRRSGDGSPQAIIRTANEPQSSTRNIAYMLAGGRDDPAPSSSQQPAVDVLSLSNIAPMDVPAEGQPSPQLSFGPFSYQGPSPPTIPNTLAAQYEGDQLAVASHCRAGSLVPGSLDLLDAPPTDAEMEAFFGSTGPAMEAPGNDTAGGTFGPPDQALAVASEEEESAAAAMVAEMMAAPSDIDLAMASYEATPLNADDQQPMFSLEELLELHVPIDFEAPVNGDGAMLRRLNDGEGNVQDHNFI